MSKMEAYGIKGPLLRWFCSSLKDRILTVNFGGTASNAFLAHLSVPKGPTLWHFYLLYLSTTYCEAAI